MNEEQTVWKDSPSQALNFGAYVLCVLFCWLVVPIFIGLWKWLQIHSTVYELTTQRLRIRRGLLSKRLEEIELYRVRDTTLEQPFFLRLFGAGNITIQGTDVSTPTICMRGIRRADEVRELLRQNVETMREAKKVRLFE